MGNPLGQVIYFVHSGGKGLNFSFKESIGGTSRTREILLISKKVKKERGTKKSETSRWCDVELEKLCKAQANLESNDTSKTMQIYANSPQLDIRMSVTLHFVNIFQLHIHIQDVHC